MKKKIEKNDSSVKNNLAAVRHHVPIGSLWQIGGHGRTFRILGHLLDGDEIRIRLRHAKGTGHDWGRYRPEDFSGPKAFFTRADAPPPANLCAAHEARDMIARFPSLAGEERTLRHLLAPAQRKALRLVWSASEARS